MRATASRFDRFAAVVAILLWQHGPSSRTDVFFGVIAIGSSTTRWPGRCGTGCRGR